MMEHQSAVERPAPGSQRGEPIGARGSGRGRGRGRGQAFSNSRGRPRGHNRGNHLSVRGRPSSDQPACSPSESTSTRRQTPARAGRSRGVNHRSTTGNHTNPPTSALSEARRASNEPKTSPPVTSVRGGRTDYNARRQGFGTHLTEAAPSGPDGPNLQGDASGDKSNNQVAGSTSLSTQDLSLSARLTLELSTSVYECLICFSTVSRFQPIYHCKNCFAIFHLRCSSEWASRSVIDTSNKAQILRDRDGIACSEEAARGCWRCPGCQHRHIGQESVPTTYKCWCGKVEHPKRGHRKQEGEGRPKASIPHGCGMSCGKSIAEGCTHACALECHPGSCPPCPAVIKTACYCLKTLCTIRCSQLNPIQSHLNPINESLLSCEQICNRPLSCGLHFCTQTCHPGDCGECEVTRDKTCYCGRVVKTDEKCSALIVSGDPLENSLQACHSPEGLEWLGEFSCQTSCPWKFDCNIHSCPSVCHPHSSSKRVTCPFSPSILTTCPCGATPLPTRTACDDPITTCENPCRKLLSACGHACQKLCHTGPCSGPCKELITTVCRCGKDSIIRPCCEVELLRETAIEAAASELDSVYDPVSIGEEAVEFRCERICRVLRHCGKHTCNRTCCPLAFLEGVIKTGKNKKTQSRHQAEEEDPQGLHQCNLICNRTLNCGLHSCQLRDHKGPCPTCLQANFDEVACHCGATVIQPPVPCGTIINCSQPCRRGPLPCGHPIAPHQCHEAPECPPCPFLANKPCQCDKKSLIRNVRCSQRRVTCGQICGNLLSCGAHRCFKLCHPIGECETCDQPCGKPRPYCGHGCQIKCHAPSVCSSEKPCQAIIDVRCQCGHIVQKVTCSSNDLRPEGNRDRLLRCNNDCAIYQRNLALASAFVNDEETSAKVDVGIEWSDELLQFCQQNLVFVKLIESLLEEFLNSQPPKISYLCQPQNHVKRKFTCELAEVYGLSCQCLDEEPRRSVMVNRKPNSRVPRPLLSQAFESARLAQQTAPVSVPTLKTDLQSLPSAEDRPEKMNAILLQGVFGHDESSLQGLIRGGIGTDEFQLTWVKDEDVVLKINKTAQPLSRSGDWLRSGKKSLRLSVIFDNLTGLLDQASFCTGIFPIKVDEAGQVLERTSLIAKSTPSPEPPRSRWNTVSSTPISISNSFGALSLQQRQPNDSQKAKQTSMAGGIVGGGFNRPPTAVMAPIASTSRRERQEVEEVVDDWEDALS